MSAGASHHGAGFAGAAAGRRGVRLRPARPGDAEALGRILSDWIEATPWMPRIHTRDEDRGFAAMMIAGMSVTVAEIGRPVGFLARRGDFVHALYLAAAAQGQGIGRRLMALAKADEPRLTLWTFQANARARAFYAREGFREVERTDGAHNDEKLPDVRLEWVAPVAGPLARFGRWWHGRT